MTEGQEDYGDGVTAMQLEEIQLGVLEAIAVKGPDYAAALIVAQQVEILYLRKALGAAGIPIPEHDIGMARIMLGLEGEGFEGTFTD